MATMQRKKILFFDVCSKNAQEAQARDDIWKTFVHYSTK